MVKPVSYTHLDVYKRQNVYRPEVWTPDEAKGVDLLIVSLKYGALPAALDDIKAATGDNTIAVSYTHL